MERIEIYNLSIEVTRLCNMQCEHCLRGDAEDMSMSIDYVDSLFQKIRYVSSLTLTGGEPSLCPAKIMEILESAKKYGVEISNFYIATNGREVSDAFLNVVIQLYTYCSDNEISSLELSNDEYHGKVPEKNLRRLRAFRFFRNKYDPKHRWPAPINEGRGVLWGTDRFPTNYVEVEDMRVGGGEIYLNCEGNLIAGCDWSYDSQREHANTICHVNDFSMEQVEAYIAERDS